MKTARFALKTPSEPVFGIAKARALAAKIDLRKRAHFPFFLALKGLEKNCQKGHRGDKINRGYANLSFIFEKQGRFHPIRLDREH